MFGKIARTLWGDFESKEEIQKFSLLAVIFGFIIGTYWALRPIKDSIFNAIVGMDYQPKAKMISLLVIIPIILLYSKLISMYPRQKVFYILSVVYSVAAVFFYFAFNNPVYGLENTVKGADRIIGWAWYVFVESYGSLFPALFWAFTTDTTAPKSAQRGFPMIVLFGQMGNILGPTILNTRFLGTANSAPIVGVCAVLIIVSGLVFWAFMAVTPEEQLRGYEDVAHKSHEAEPGFFEGLKLLVTKPYLFGIFAIIMIYEIIVTVIDFHFKSTVAAQFTVEKEVSAYLSSYASMTGVVATICILLGINSIQKLLGMRASLLFLPILVIFTVLVIKFNPASITIAFWIMVLSKAVNYALNQPTLKQLYIPTTKDTKYKAQAWMEMFGGRGAKAGGSFINDFAGGFKAQYGLIDGVVRFLTFSSIISLGLVGVWFFAAVYVAREYESAIKENKVVC